MSNKTITIDLTKLAKAINPNNLDHDTLCDNGLWTDNIMDELEKLFGFETELAEVINKNIITD